MPHRLQSLRDLRSILDGLADGVTVVDEAGHILFATQPAASLLGFASVEDLVQASPEAVASRFEYLDDDGRVEDPAPRLPSQVVAAGAPEAEGVIHYRLTDDASEHWALVRSRELVLADGSMRVVTNVFHDLTPEFLVERRLAAQNREYATVVRSIGDALITTDLQGRISYLNPIAEQLTGWTTDEAVGRPHLEVFNIVNEYSGEPVESPVHRVLQEGIVVGLANHTELIRKDGTRIPIDDSGAPICEGTRIHGAVLVFRDVSERKLREERRRYLAEAGAVLSSTLDLETVLKQLSQVVVPRLADWCAIEIVGETGRDIEQVTVAHSDPAKLAAARELRKAYPLTWDHPEYLPKALTEGVSELLPEIPLDMQLKRVTDEADRKRILDLNLRSGMIVPLKVRGRILGMITFVASDSGRRFDDEDLAFAESLADRAALAIDNARLYRSAQLAVGLRDEFLAIASHELRTPLTALGLQTHLLRRAVAGVSVPEPLSRSLDKVESQVQKLAVMVDNLLDVSRMTQSGLAVERSPIDLAAVVQAAVHRLEPQLEQARIPIEREVSSLVGTWDAMRLEQLVTNLVSNAVKYAPGAPLRVRLQRVGDDAQLEVQDGGPGIAPEVVERIFERFVRGVRGDASPGLGLGLYISKQIVQAHGGSIAVESAPGQGTTFRVRLPLQPPA